MNAEHLLAQFERISEAPDALARLRRFILDLAVRGKMVEQDPEDEPAEFSLPGVSSKNLGGGQLSAAIPYCLPPSWSWRAVSAITETVTDGEHATPKRISEPDVPLVTAKNVREGYMDYSKTDWVSRETALKAWSRCRPQVGDLLMVCVGATTGRLTVLREARDMVLVRSVALIRPSIISDSDYLEYAIRSPVLQSQIWASVKAAAQPCLYLNRIGSLLIPLPPLAEQHRIVAKVDELMALCDQLEAARNQREQGRERLVAATLQRLNQPSEDPASYRQDASFALQVLPSLTTTPAQIKQLRQTILNLAVRGKLVEQDPEDEPAEEQLERITLTKLAQGRKERAFKKNKSDMSIESFQYLLPSGWASATLADLVTILNGRAYKQSELLDSGTPVLRVGNLFTSNKWYYSNLELDDDKCIDDGDLIFAWSASFGPFIWKGGRVIYHYHIWKLPLHRPADLSLDYLYLYLLHKTAEIKEAGHGISMVHMTKEKMEGLEVPLPPLAEQHRIVAKVDELMALCDQLEQQLSQADQQRRRLLEAVLAEALGGRLSTEQEESHAAIA